MWYDKYIRNKSEFVTKLCYNLTMHDVTGHITDDQFIELFNEAVGLKSEDDCIEDIVEYLVDNHNDSNDLYSLIGFIEDKRDLCLNYNFTLIQEQPMRIYFDTNNIDSFQRELNDVKDISKVYEEWCG